MRSAVISLLCLISLLQCPQISASNDENLLDKLYDKLVSSCTELEYTYTTFVSGARISGSGIIYIQDRKWYMDGNGVRMWCDGNTIWTVDPELKEALIDSVSESEGVDIMSNPAVLFINLHRFFKLSDTICGDDGKSLIYVLKPVESAEIEYVNLGINIADTSITSLDLALEDGSDVKISVKSMKLMDAKDGDFFRPQLSFDSDWIVTDLR